MSTVQLTIQQQAVVNHREGPALVYAVAGAGKTTAMIHRIANLIQQGLCAPEQILATTFNKDAADEICHRLHKLPNCQSASAITLHSLGYSIIRAASKKRLLPHLHKDAAAKVDQAAKEILREAKLSAIQDNVDYRQNLDHLDDQDFGDYVSLCKGNLMYADLSAAQLPPKALELATQASEPQHNPWYLDLYRRFEQARQTLGLYTFDDMLLTGWELLIRDAGLCREFQSKYRFVLVDEYQDLNLVQSEMLDIITAHHRNYMAVGDDDQTIYTWRGASPDHMLSFERRYKAARYFMTENFRCRAGQIALANAVIAHKKEGMRKQLQLTQGFGGVTKLYPHRDETAVATHMVERIQAACTRNFRYRNMAILVRVYAQTGPIEDALIAAEIPYVVVGSEPFYARQEVRTLLDYWRLALQDQQLKMGQQLSPQEQRDYEVCWKSIYWRPKRYLSSQHTNRLSDEVLRRQIPLVGAVELVREQLNARQATALDRLVDDLIWLATHAASGERAARPAHLVLSELVERLQYREFLREHSEFSGAEHAENVDAFINYARNHGSMSELVHHLEALMAEASATRSEDDNAVKITSIHRAKGREWDVVLVPGCEDGLLPNKRATTAAEIEEERRLLYVAITRARHELHLYHCAKSPISPFLKEAKYSPLLKKLARLEYVLQRPPANWQLPADAGAVVAYTNEFNFHSYFRSWWNVPVLDKWEIGRRAAGFLKATTELGVEVPFRPRNEDWELWNGFLNRREEVVTMSLPKKVDRRTSTTKPIASQANRPLPNTTGTPNHSSPKSHKHWMVGDGVKHPKHGFGIVHNKVSINGVTWLEVRFGKDFIQIAPNDPDARRVQRA